MSVADEFDYRGAYHAMERDIYQYVTYIGGVIDGLKENEATKPLAAILERRVLEPPYGLAFMPDAVRALYRRERTK